VSWKALSQRFLPRLGQQALGRALFAAILGAAAGVSALPAHSGVGVIDERGGSCLTRHRACLSVYGYISQADAEVLRDFFQGRNLDPGSVEVYLNSPGGDVKAAIQIGRQLRDARAAAYVFTDAQCSSSCVFLLAGATRRAVDGSVAIHRPAASDAVRKTDAQTRLEYESLLREIEYFFRSMNVSQRLFDAMISIPTDEPRYLSVHELSRFGLAGTDRVEQELEGPPHAVRPARYSSEPTRDKLPGREAAAE
jgi:ATP-dependent protease ClpP protease subunit